MKLASFRRSATARASHTGEQRCSVHPEGRRVNAVAPGLIAKDSEGQIKTNQRRERASAMQAFKRLARPEDIGGVVAFLASDDAQWITGDIVIVDGGSQL